LTNSLILHFTR